MIIQDTLPHLLLVPRGLIADHITMRDMFLANHCYEVVGRNYFNGEIGLLYGKVVLILNHNPEQNFQLLNHMELGGSIDQTEGYYQQTVQDHLDYIMNNKKRIERAYLISQI